MPESLSLSLSSLLSSLSSNTEGCLVTATCCLGAAADTGSTLVTGAGADIAGADTTPPPPVSRKEFTGLGRRLKRAEGAAFGC